MLLSAGFTYLVMIDSGVLKIFLLLHTLSAFFCYTRWNRTNLQNFFAVGTDCNVVLAPSMLLLSKLNRNHKGDAHF